MTQAEPAVEDFLKNADDLTADDHLVVETEKDVPDDLDAGLPVPDQDPNLVPHSAGGGLEAAPIGAVADVLTTARSQLGTVERPPGSNRTPYGAEYGNDGQAWCAMFVWWVFRKSLASSLIPKTAYTPTFAQWFRDHRQWGNDPRPGAVVFFDFPNDNVNRISHVGLVEAVNGDGTVTTIEGNTSSGQSGSQHDGDGVWRRTRRTGIVGYGYPAYGGGTVPPPTGDQVRRTQVAVHVAVDGDWGPATDRAVSLVRSAARGHLQDVKATQRAVGTRDDGVWGPNSKAALDSTVRALQAAWGTHIDGDWGPKTEAAYDDVRRRHFRGA
jgi:surface antigen